MNRIRVKAPSPSMVVALIALFVALSGAAVATVTVNSVRSNNIVNGQVKNADLANNSVGKLKIKSGAVDSSKIVDGSVADADIAGVAGAKVSGTVANATNAATAANADKLDNLDSTQLKPRWLIVAANGTILAQSGGFSMVQTGGGGNWINAGAPVNARPIHATVHYAGGEGQIRTAACGSGAGGTSDTVGCIVAGTNNVNHFYVETRDGTGALATRSFVVSIDAP